MTNFELEQEIKTILISTESKITKNYQACIKAKKLIATVISTTALMACGGGGGSNVVSGSASTGTAPAPTSGLVPDCSGVGCGAINSTTYSGSGLGTWNYENAGSSPSVIDINIKGVTSKNTVTLVFTNSTSETLASTPIASDTESISNLASGAQVYSASKKLITSNPEDLAHDEMNERNKNISKLISKLPASFSDISISTTQKVLETPAIGATKTWIESYSTPVTYSTTAEGTCQLPSGRSVVLWRDPNAASLVTSSDITAMLTTLCGDNGGLSRLSTLLGDVWGTDASPSTGVLIQDGESLQDINIVMLPVSNVSWAGYFWAGNNILKTYSSEFASSNESLVFFINAYQVYYDRSFALSTLLHEATHMTNFYQKVVSRGLSGHDVWLEETSAMMTEDLIGPSVINGYNKIDFYRIPSYMATGGGVSYINWTSSEHYGLGGGFGAYLNRQYGVSLYQQLVSGCTSGEPATSSYSCLDTLIKANSGVGMATDFSRYGASLFSGIKSSNNGVGKYGFPAKTTGGYSLQSIDVGAKASYIPKTARSLGTAFKATTHTYLTETVSSTALSYSRKVTVPAKSSLTIMVQ